MGRTEVHIRPEVYMNFRPLYDWGIINYTSSFPLLQGGVRGKEKTRKNAGNESAFSSSEVKGA
jgi:hypothetical protein